MPPLTAVSLFTGVGGFDLGFEQAGVRLVAQCEVDPHAQSVLRRHWPDVPLLEDVTRMRGSDHPADIVMGGFPCQDVSVAGKRAGLAGERSGLFFEAMRVVREMREATDGVFPRWLVLENVPGLFSSNKGRDFGAVLEHLLEAEVPAPRSGRWAPAGLVRGGGRSVAWRLLDSQHFGVPQRRRRIFLVADFGGERAGDVLFEPEGVRGDPAAREPAGAEPAAGVAGGARGGRGGLRADGVVSAPVTAKWAKGTGGPAGDETQNLVPVAFNPNQAGTSPGPVAPPLGASEGGGNAGAIAFSSKDSGQDAGELAPTLRAMNHAASHANGGGQVAVALREGGPGYWMRDERAGPLRAASGGDAVQSAAVIFEPGAGEHPPIYSGDDATADPITVREGATWTNEGTTFRVRNLVPVPIQDGRGLEKRQNGFGVGEPGDPGYTLDATGGQAVAFEPRYFNRSGVGGKPSPVTNALRAGAMVGDSATCVAAPEAVAFAENSRAEVRLEGGDGRRTGALTGGGGKPGQGAPTVAAGYTVRRLTPRECERLQGFPDDWTRYAADGRELANTHRYRMMGNAVTVNVAAWLAARLRAFGLDP